jgi:HPt (histidine-containing phosphotransfer) domain-containing protein
VERLAHGCAGISMNCGMVGIAPLCKELEHAAREDRLTDGAQWCTAIAEAFERIKGFLHTSQLPVQGWMLDGETGDWPLHVGQSGVTVNPLTLRRQC